MGSPSGQEQFEVQLPQDLLECPQFLLGAEVPTFPLWRLLLPGNWGMAPGLLRECLTSQETPSQLCGEEPEQWKPALMDPALESPGWKVRKWKVKGESLRAGKFIEHQELWLEL